MVLLLGLPRAMAAMLVRPEANDFSNPAAWDAAYASSNGAMAEWLLPYQSVRSILLEELRDMRDLPVLELGCGTSNLAASLCEDGFRDVTACDASRVAVEVCQRVYGAVNGLCFKREDARRLSFDSATFAAVVDKGTLDAILSCEGYDYEGRLVAAELVRVLKPNGCWICISLMPPSVVIPVMQRPEWGESLRLVDEIEGHRVYVANRIM